MFKYIFLLLLLTVSAAVYAQKTKVVTAKYTYYAPDNVSIDEAKHIALQRAKAQSISDTFGSVVSQNNSTIVKNDNGNSETHVLSIGGSEAKGEWLETIGNPEYDISYEQNMLVVKATVKGKIRESTQAKYDIITKVLRNGTEDKNEQYDFIDSDDMYMSFLSPIDGFLAIYLLDENSMDVFCLLPYKSSSLGAWPIKHDIRYLFFHADNNDEVDDYTLTCSKDKEFNQIILIFSTNEFAKANSTNVSNTIPRQLSYSDFAKWLEKTRIQDEGLMVIKKEIVISKKSI